MVLFFDRSVGKTIPEMLIDLKIPIQVEYHQKHFKTDEEDDIWLPIVGKKGWLVIGHDQYHRKENELMAIKQYGIGCFYLWGAESPKWDKMKAFVLAYDRIISADNNTQKPYIYIINKRGRLKSHSLS